MNILSLKMVNEFYHVSYNFEGVQFIAHWSEHGGLIWFSGCIPVANTFMIPMGNYFVLLLLLKATNFISPNVR